MKMTLRMMTMAVVMAAGAVGVGPMATAEAVAMGDDEAGVKSLLKAELPVGAVEIVEAMKSAKAGETITIRGNVAMAKDAFAENQASFILVDESTRHAARPDAKAMPDTDKDIPASGRATITIMGASGKPLGAGLNGQHGLRAGAEVFVTGRVENANGSDALTLSVISMHIPKAQLPVGFFAEKTPESVKDVSEARKTGSIKKGDEVVLRGRVGGSKTPFVPGRAVLTLMGRGLKSCNENPDDTCSKPWDYCCETKDDILAHSVTVQVVDANGQILKTDLKGRRGLKELSEVVVVGKVVAADGKAVVVNATSMHLTQ